MSKLIKLVNSPFTPPIESVLGITFHFTAPYDKTFVTLLISPNVTDYKENDDQPGISIRQVVFSQHTQETQTLRFDFSDNNTHTVNNDGKVVSIKLMSIGTEKVQGQEFVYCELFVSEIDK